jgi:hypothetical protein
LRLPVWYTHNNGNCQVLHTNPCIHARPHTGTCAHTCAKHPCIHTLTCSHTCANDVRVKTCSCASAQYTQPRKYLWHMLNITYGHMGIVSTFTKYVYALGIYCSIHICICTHGMDCSLCTHMHTWDGLQAASERNSSSDYLMEKSSHELGNALFKLGDILLL